MKSKWIVQTKVPEEVYTDREDLLDYFFRAALATSGRRTESTVLLGHRRMGKTEIFKRVVNRLFFEQDHENPEAVVPVFYNFPDSPVSEQAFALNYIENFLRYYLAFHTNNPKLPQSKIHGDRLLKLARDAAKWIKTKDTLEWVIETYETIRENDAPIPVQVALEVPRGVSDVDDSSIVMFLDEFQNTRLPQYNFDIVGLMQVAVESMTCPHFVTGSSMSILAKEIIGRGSLYGRFTSKLIEALPGYHGGELSRKAAKHYQAKVPEIMNPVIAERCGGNPFYITAVVHQAVESDKTIHDEKILNELLALDITSGFIWGELSDQVNRWIERLNDSNITKWVLYLSSLEEMEDKEKENRQLNIKRIQTELKQREGINITEAKIKEVLIKLSRGDLLEYYEFGNWFGRIKDPILLEFLKAWGKIEVEWQNRRKIQNELQNQWSQKENRFNEYKGYFAEVLMAQVLLNQQQKKLPGRLFHSPRDISFPRFIFVNQRVRMGVGKGKEIDIWGGAGPEQWVCESKWVQDARIGIDELKSLEQKAELVKNSMQGPPPEVKLWLFAHEGITLEAEKWAEDNGIYWTSRQDLDEILSLSGLREIPDFS